MLIKMSWLNDLAIVLYAISVLGYFIDFLQNNRKANQISFWLLSIVWVLQTTSFVVKMIATERFPILTIFEGLFFYSWVLTTLSLILNRMHKMDFLLFFTNIVGFIMMTLYLFMPDDKIPEIVTLKLLSDLLIIHITMALIAYGTFTLAFVFSVMYLLQYHMIKRKVWNGRMKRLGSLSKLGDLSFKFCMVGVPLLFTSLILGMTWATNKLPHFTWLDVKVVTSFLVIIIYSFFLYQKEAKKRQGPYLAWLNIFAFLFVLINLFLSTTLSKFHIWYQ